MVQTIVAVLKNDIVSWQNEPEIVTEVTAIESELDTANNLNVDLLASSKNAAKNAVKEDFSTIVLLTLKLCNKISVYAKRNNNHELLMLSDQSSSSLSAGKRNDAIDRCLGIVSKAETMLNVLQPFKVTQDEINTIHQHIENYKEHTNRHSVELTNSKTQNQDLATIVGSLHKRVDILDNLVYGFIDDESVIARYKTARVVHDFGKNKTNKNKTTDESSSTSQVVK